MRKSFGIKGKTATVFVLMSLAVLTSISLASYRTSRQQVIEQYGDFALGAAHATAALIDADRIDTFLNDGPDQEYLATINQLEDLKDAFGLSYLYIVRPIGDGRLLYIFDVGADDTNPSLVEELGGQTVEYDVYNIIENAYRDGAIAAEPIITNSEYGWLASVYIPLRASDGTIAGVVGVDMPMSRELAVVRLQTVRIVLLAALIILASLAILLLLTEWRVLSPIVRLSNHMKSFSSDVGKLDDFDPPRSRDELQDIGESYNYLLANLRTYAHNLAGITAEQERISTELNVAAQIQSAMLPPVDELFSGPVDGTASLINTDRLQLFASMIPAFEVGGDFYDFFALDERRVAVVIADVSGKGIPAALFMMVAKILIKVTALNGDDPQSVLYKVNNLLSKHNDAAMFVTVFLGYLDLADGSFTYVNAGHNPPLVKRNTCPWEVLKCPASFVVGGFDDTSFRQACVRLGAGDSLLLYTDGVTEATSSDLELYGEKRLVDLVNRCMDSDPAVLVQTIEDDLVKFSDGYVQADDITMLALRIGALRD